MSETRFTPGPWHIVPHGDGDALVICEDEEGNWRIAFMALPGESRHAKKVIPANAHLISAAPDLYAALEAARAQLVTHCGEPDDSLYGDQIHAQTIKLIDAALKKARGES